MDLFFSAATLLTVLVQLFGQGQFKVSQEPPPQPEGYYAFIESPNVDPPWVRRPPYLHSDKECPGVRSTQRSLNNLCGDLNKGYIPRNPMEQNVLGSPYPFDLIKNKTLQFFSRTLPILKNDDTLPKVARFQENDVPPISSPPPKQRLKRETESTNGTSIRESRKFCDNGGVLCMLYKAINGEPLGGGGTVERREDVSTDAVEYHSDPLLPPTPCPAKVEYATPVFAKNYQGVWRYVVQIPYEGYFTQTVEVTRCLQSRCYYMDGGCMSSPRWTSLLVAEIYYPDTFLPSSGTRWTAPRKPVTPEDPPPVHDFQNYQQYLHKRAGKEADASPSSHCDGVDEIGCFQVRLYYDWFLIPGSCKCWRPDYFSRYIRRKVVSRDL